MAEAPAPQPWSLLPAGLRDVLAPKAAHEAALLTAVLGYVAARGYEQVKPPLVEFEASMAEAAGPETLASMMRVMDAVSTRTMVLRADMTVQVARIAATRLSQAPRPLRLSYAGDVVRVRGSQLRPDRQFAQAGFELIGPDGVSADVEVLGLVVDGLAALGVRDVSVDLTVPALVPLLCAAHGLDASAQEQVLAATGHHNPDALAGLPEPVAGLLAQLMDAAGEASEVVNTLGTLALPEPCAVLVHRLSAVMQQMQALRPGLSITVDTVERRNFAYHKGVAFTVFAKGARNALARGGRYVTHGANPEPACGATFLMDTLLHLVPDVSPAARVYVPRGDDVDAVVAAGYVAVPGLDEPKDREAEARLLRCAMIWQDGKAVVLPEE